MAVLTNFRLGECDPKLFYFQTNQEKLFSKTKLDKRGKNDFQRLTNQEKVVFQRWTNQETLFPKDRQSDKPGKIVFQRF
jgi:hypothetical protein